MSITTNTDVALIDSVNQRVNQIQNDPYGN